MIEAGPKFLKIESERKSRLFISMLYPISRSLLGDELADQLNFPKARKRWLCALFRAAVWTADRYPQLLPRKARNFMGVQFWLESSDYTSPHPGSD